MGSADGWHAPRRRPPPGPRPGPARPTVAARAAHRARDLHGAVPRCPRPCGARSPLLGYVVKQVNHMLTGADLAWQASVGPGPDALPPHGCRAGSRRRRRAGDACSSRASPSAPCASAGSWPTAAWTRRCSATTSRSGAGARVLGPISLGDGCMVGANAVVLVDVPAGHLAVGVPGSRDSARAPTVNRPSMRVLHVTESMGAGVATAIGQYARCTDGSSTHSLRRAGPGRLVLARAVARVGPARPGAEPSGASCGSG